MRWEERCEERVSRSSLVSAGPPAPVGKRRGEVESSGSSPCSERRALRMREARWERERERWRGSMVEEEGESGEGSGEGRERRIDS